MVQEDWQFWSKCPEDDLELHFQRINGTLPEMESSKQLVKLLSDVYEPKMTVLDMGCNIGHYLQSIRKQFPTLDYTGFDAYETFINKAKEIFSHDQFSKFDVKDIFNPISPENPFDITFSCNVILHLPDFRIPIKNIISSTKQVCFIRTLFGEKTSIVKIPEIANFDDSGNPLDYFYYNTWEKDYFTNFVNDLGWDVEFISDEFNSEVIQNEFENTNKNVGTKIINGKQVIGNIIANWEWAQIKPKN